MLFADAVGSTEFAHGRDPEVVFGRIRAAVAVMVDATQRHGGFVCQFRGDGIMALFGAPVATEQAPSQAVLAALEMQARLGSEERSDRLQFRIGVHTVRSWLAPLRRR